MPYTFEKRKNNRRNNASSIKSDPSQETQLPNSLVMRIMEDPAAEQEADRLSQGVTSRTPGEITREMGSRLGADFSDVQFHSDTLSMNRSRAMGARAWAQGRDVHFGRGGFDPKIAAHELVHTVQQGAVDGNVSRSVPNGTVQLFRGEDDNAVRRRVVPANASNLELMNGQRESSEYGQKIFSDLKGPVKKLAQKGGSRIRNVNEASGISFLYNLGERDYSGKEILRDIASREVINKDDQYDRTDEYEGFLSYMKGRTDNVGLEEASLQAGILNGQPKYQHNLNNNVNKRAYEMTEAELTNDTFNPTNDTEISKVLESIDNAHTAFEAWHRLLEYTEDKRFTRQELAHSGNWVNFAHQPVAFLKNAQGQDVDLTEAQVNQYKQNLAAVNQSIKDANFEKAAAKDMGNKVPETSPWRERFKQKYITACQNLRQAQAAKKNLGVLQYRHKSGEHIDINLPLFKAKVKNMVRQVRDYPELKRKIGAMNIQWNQTEGAFREDMSQNVMAASTSRGAENKAMIHYDAWIDRDTPEGQQKRDEINNNLNSSIGNLSKVGNHELGHVLESTLNTTDEKYEKGQESNDILQTVLPNVMNQQELSQVNYNAEDGENAFGKNVYKGQIDTTSPIFAAKHMSSSYGRSMPKEWFAEAFHDVYTKGAGAKQTSIEIVKEYEKRQTAQQKKNFQKKQRGFLSNLFVKTRRWFSKMWNYGARPGAQGMAQNANANPAAAVPQQNAVNPNAGPAAVVPPVNANPQPQPQNDILNNNPQPAVDNTLQHYADNLLDPNMLQNANDVLAPDLVAERPKKRGRGKKRK